MKNRTLVSMLMLIAIGGYAQKPVTFQVGFKPNTRYSTDMKVVSTAEINFEGDENTLSQMKSAGMTLPALVEINQLMTAVMNTETWRDNGEIPLTIEYTKMEITQTMNGSPMPQQPNPLAGMIMRGHGDKKGVMHLSSDSSSGNEQLKKLISDMVEKMQTQVVFPEKPMKVGDVFTQDVPMEIPIQGTTPIKMVVSTEYKLTSYTDAIAIFDTRQTITLDMTIEQASAKGSGSGTGVMTFDRKQNYVSKYTSEMDMTFGAQLGALNMTATTHATSGLEVTFTDL